MSLSISIIASHAKLVDVKKIIPDICVDLKYATKNNFTGKVIYSFTTCFLLEEVALKLRDAQKELQSIGLKLKIWDGYRPMIAQQKFWESMPDPRYVSYPTKGGRHTRGTAVDITLVTHEGIELPMPSGFDAFSKKAHRNYGKYSNAQILSLEIITQMQNRQLLEDILERHGFKGLSTEWWHFDFVGWEQYPPLDFDPGSC